jgi:hypothetical protein
MSRTFETVLPKLVDRAGLCAGLRVHLRADDLERRVVRDRHRACCPTTRTFVGLEQYAKLWEMDRWYVALKNLGIFSVLYVGGSMLHRHGAGHLAGPEDARRRPAAHHLPLPHGAVIHRHRHRLEVDAQPQPGPGKTHARPGLEQSFNFDWLVHTDTWPSTAW